MLKKMLSTRYDAIVNLDVSLLLLRVGAAFLMFYNHGLSKLTGVMNGEFGGMNPIGLGPEISLTLSAFAEGICALLILFGLWTRLAAIPLVINMFVAVFFFHVARGDSLGGFETALLFLIIFTVLMFTGGGKYSLDDKLYGRS